MATLAGTTIASTFDSVLHVEDNTAGLVATSTDSRVIQDGVGANSALALATDSVRITSTNKLYFNDVGGEYISGNGSILSIVGGSEIDLTATTIDINGTGDVSGTLTVGGILTVNNGAVFNEASADVDFRVESNTNLNMLFVDGGADRVGIGTAAPDQLFHVNATGASAIALIEAGSGSYEARLSLYADSGENAIDQWHIVSTTDNYLKFINSTNVRMSITNDGNVGIGTIPTYLLHAEGAGSVGAKIASTDNNCSLIISTGDESSKSSGVYFDAVDSTKGSIIFNHNATPANQNMRFIVGDNAITALDIEGDGYIGINKTSPSETLDVVTPLGTSAADLNIAHFEHTSDQDDKCLGIQVEFSAADPNNGAQTFIHCLDSAGNRFICYSNGELWQAIGDTTIDSDERLKENIVDATSKLDDINKLKVRNFNLRKTDKETGQVLQKGETASKKRIGFIAQELEEIFPSLVKDHETVSAREAIEAVAAKDAVLDSDGNIVEEAIEAVEAVTERKQLIRKSLTVNALVPMLVKAIQELSAKVTALENA